MRRKLFTLTAVVSAVLCVGAVGSLALSVASVAAWVHSRYRTDLLIHVRSPTSASEWSLASNGLTYCRLEQANSGVDPGWYKDLHTPGWYGTGKEDGPGAYLLTLFPARAATAPGW